MGAILRNLKFKILSKRYINPAKMSKGSRNLYAVALKTAEISSRQISSNNGGNGNGNGNGGNGGNGA